MDQRRKGERAPRVVFESKTDPPARLGDSAVGLLLAVVEP